MNLKTKLFIGLAVLMVIISGTLAIVLLGGNGGTTENPTEPVNQEQTVNLTETKESSITTSDGVRTVTETNTKYEISSDSEKTIIGVGGLGDASSVIIKTPDEQIKVTSPDTIKTVSEYPVQIIIVVNDQQYTVETLTSPYNDGDAQ